MRIYFIYNIKVHIHILNELKSQINTDKNLELLIKNLDKLYEKLQIENKVNLVLKIIYNK